MAGEMGSQKDNSLILAILTLFFDQAPHHKLLKPNGKVVFPGFSAKYCREL
jgi:hypothetical protein